MKPTGDDLVTETQTSHVSATYSHVQEIAPWKSLDIGDHAVKLVAEESKLEPEESSKRKLMVDLNVLETSPRPEHATKLHAKLRYHVDGGHGEISPHVLKLAEEGFKQG